MLQKNWNKQLPVRLLGISLSGFAKDNDSEQISIFNMLEEDHERNSVDKIDKLETAINDIRQKYGSSIINRAILMKKDNKN